MAKLTFFQCLHKYLVSTILFSCQYYRTFVFDSKVFKPVNRMIIYMFTTFGCTAFGQNIHVQEHLVVSKLTLMCFQYFSNVTVC